MKLALLAVAALGVTALAGAGRAAAPDESSVVAGPVIAGAGYAWIERHGDRAEVKVSLGGRVSTVYEGAADDRPSLAGSSELLVIRPLADSKLNLGRLLVGRPGGRLWPLEFGHCRGRFGVSGRTVAYQHGCREHSSVVVLQRLDPETGAVEQLRRVSLDGDSATFSLDGDWLAWERHDEIVVTNLATGRDVYTVSPQRDSGASFDVAEDGKLVVVTRAPGDRWWRAEWYAPRAPVAHRLPVAIAAEYGPVVFTRDRLMLPRAVATSSIGELSALDLVLVDLRGRTTTIAAFPDVERRVAGPSLAFDGTRVAWVSTTVAARSTCDTGGCAVTERGAQSIVGGWVPRPAVVARVGMRRTIWRESSASNRRLMAPRLVDDGVVWLDRVRGGVTSVRGAFGDAPARLLYWDHYGAFAASGNAVAFELSTVGPAAGPYRELEPKLHDCRSEGNVDAWASLVVYMRCDEPRLAVYDVVRRRLVDEINPSGYCCDDVRIADRYVAWTSALGNVVTVYDRTRRRVVLRGFLGAPDHFRSFDLQADGTVAVRDGDRIVWFSPREPGRRVVASPRWGFGTVVLADGRVATLERTRGGARLVLVGLGGGRRTVARFAIRSEPTGFDFDGRRVAWSERRTTRFWNACLGRTEPCPFESGFVSLRVEAWPAVRARELVHAPFVERRQP